jgi:hypothetical protein
MVLIWGIVYSTTGTCGNVTEMGCCAAVPFCGVPLLRFYFVFILSVFDIVSTNKDYLLSLTSFRLLV